MRDKPRRDRFIRPWFLVILCFISIPRAITAPSTVIEIAPGPQVITPAEREIKPERAGASEVGVVLIDETDRDDSAGRETRISRHFRAKIFSTEGQDLAAVEIPLNGLEGTLVKWWGWTLLPDGTIREVKQVDLKEQQLPRSGASGIGILNTRLPGVVPGCVIDYGYVAVERDLEGWLTVDLQRDVPVRRFRYRWTPGGGYPGTYHTARTEGLAVEVVRDGRSVLVRGEGLPALVKEPWMPPERESRATATFYYRQSAETESAFWDAVAKQQIRSAAYFAQEKPIREAIASMGIPPGTDLPGKLGTAYAWLQSHVRNINLVSLTEILTAGGGGKNAEDLRAGEVLERGTGYCRQMTLLYWGIARALGADVSLVLVPDRRQRYLDRGLLTTEQFSRELVAVRAAGQPEEEVTFVDVCAGLPYGEVAWWLTDGHGLLLSPQGATEITLSASPASRNTSETNARIVFGGDGTEAAHWSRVGMRQQGLHERLVLRKSGPMERKQHLGEYCGAGGAFEVSRSEASGIDDLTAPFKLECEASVRGVVVDPTIATFRIRFGGSWIPSVPEFPSSNRANPVVFDFPKIDQVAIDIEAPAGFTSVEPPRSVQMETAYGHYALFVSKTSTGYHVDRVFSLTSTKVSVENYGALRDFLTQVSRADQTQLDFSRVVSGSFRARSSQGCRHLRRTPLLLPCSPFRDEPRRMI